MTYQEWEKSVPQAISGDALWRMKVYRVALYMTETGWQDVTTLVADRRTVALADQLYRALGSIGANVAEGYSRSSGRDRTRFYEYALGSARESRDWYYKARGILSPETVDSRITMLSEIIRMLLTLIPRERDRIIREDKIEYLYDDETGNEPPKLD